MSIFSFFMLLIIKLGHLLVLFVVFPSDLSSFLLQTHLPGYVDDFDKFKVEKHCFVEEKYLFLYFIIIFFIYISMLGLQKIITKINYNQNCMLNTSPNSQFPHP